MTIGLGLFPNVLKVTKTVECPHCGVQTPTPSELKGKTRGEMFCTFCEHGPFTVTFMEDGRVLNDSQYTVFIDSLCGTT